MQSFPHVYNQDFLSLYEIFDTNIFFLNGNRDVVIKTEIFHALLKRLLDRN